MKYLIATILLYLSIMSYGIFEPMTLDEFKPIWWHVWYIVCFAYTVFVVFNLITWNKPKKGLETNTMLGVMFYFVALIAFRIIRIFTGDLSQVFFFYITAPFFILNTGIWLNGLKKN